MCYVSQKKTSLCIHTDYVVPLHTHLFMHVLWYIYIITKLSKILCIKSLH